MSSSATVRVEKATSDLLIGPDWTMNIDICDSVNSNHWEAKDVVKAVKKRLQHKNPKVQLLALTLLETMVKNCGDYVHFQIAEKNILQEMTKIVKKKTDMHVRDKILALLDSWQDAFGGPGGKYPQYYWAYDELRRSGVSFPHRSADAAPIFTPPVTHISPGQVQVGYGMPSHSSKRLDEAMASDIENLSRSNLDSIRNVMEVLADILQTVNPSDGEAVKDELIIDLETQCRSNQRKLMQMLTSTVDEELLGQGLELNDSLQSLLAKHDAIASGSTFPAQVIDAGALTTKTGAPGLKPTEVQDSTSRRTPAAAALPFTAAVRAEFDNEEEEEDDFAQLARRHTRTSSLPSTGVTDGTSNVMSKNTGNPTTSLPQSSQIPTSSNALALLDPPAPVRTTKEQDIIDLLSLTLSTTTTSPHTPQNAQTPSTFNQRGHLTPISLQPSQTSLGNQGHVTLNSYVAPWAQPHQSQQPQPQPHLQQQSPQPQPQPQPQSHPQTQPQTRPQHWGQPQLGEPTQNSPMQTATQPQTHSQHWTQPQLQQQAQNSQSRYPAPPWATTAGYYGSKNPSSTAYMFSTPQASTAPYVPLQGGRPLQNYNSFPSRGINESSIHGDALVSQSPRNPTPTVGHKPFIPSYRLFEDLNVLGNVDGRGKVNGSTSSVMGMSGSSGRGMVSGARNKQKASEC